MECVNNDPGARPESLDNVACLQNGIGHDGVLKMDMVTDVVYDLEGNQLIYYIQRMLTRTECTNWN